MTRKARVGCLVASGEKSLNRFALVVCVFNGSQKKRPSSFVGVRVRAAYNFALPVMTAFQMWRILFPF